MKKSRVLGRQKSLKFKFSEDPHGICELKYIVDAFNINPGSIK